MAWLGRQIRPMATNIDGAAQEGPDVMTLFLASDSLTTIRPANSPEDFTSDIPGTPLTLKGNWAVALLDITYGNKSNLTAGSILIMSNLCKETLAFGRAAPVLRQMVSLPLRRRTDRYTLPCYVPLDTTHPISVVRIYIRSGRHERISLGTGVVTCTLQLVRTS